jgi:hypothetical protein
LCKSDNVGFTAGVDLGRRETARLFKFRDDLIASARIDICQNERVKETASLSD